jgi:hypothetical protein
MQYRFTRMLAGMRRGLELLSQYSGRLQKVNTQGAQLALQEVVDALSALAQAQTAHRFGRSGGVKTEKQLARILRVRHIAPLVRVSRMRVPEVAALEAVRMPERRSNGSETAQLALSMADAVAPFVERLATAGLGPYFLNDLRAAANDVLAAIALKEEHRRKSVGATEAIESAIENARKVVAAVDAMVVAEARDEQPLIGEWRAVRREIRAALRTNVPAVEPTPGQEGQAAA